MLIAPVYALLVPYYAQTEAPRSPLVQKDRRLREPVAPREFPSGSVKNIGIWVKGVTQLTLGTTEDELTSAKDYFVFNKVRAGDLMDAYSTLYRMRWVAYKSGAPRYELTVTKEEKDRRYAPTGDMRKQLAAAASVFMGLFDKLSDSDKNAILEGGALKFGEMSGEMQKAFRNSIQPMMDQHFSRVMESNPSIEKPDINTLSEGTISIQEAGRAESGVRLVNISSQTNLGSYIFGWNDYDPKTGRSASGRPPLFAQEPEPAESFSRKKMLEREKKLTTLRITVPESQRTLGELLKYLSESYGLNFITNEDRDRKPLEFGCTELPLVEALDKISEVYGSWEWEASPGDFIVMRSKESHRRRQSARKKAVTP